MKKTDWQYLVDTLLFLCIVGMVFIGILMGFFLAQGPTTQESAKYFLGLHRHQWGNIHLYLSITFTLLLVIHLILSWKWIKGKARQLFKKGWGTALTLTAIASILVLFLFWFLYPKVPGAYEDYGKGAGKKAIQQQLLKEGYPVPEEKIETQKNQKKKEGIQNIKEEKKHEEALAEEHEEKLSRGIKAEDTSGILITGRMTLYDIEDETGVSARKIADKLGIPSSAPLDETLGRLRKRYLFTMQEVRDVVASLMKKR